MAGAEILRGIIDDYLEERAPFWPFYSTFMDAWLEAEFDDDEIGEFWYDEVHETIYMANEGRVGRADEQVGLIGEEGLRRRLLKLREHPHFTNAV